MMNQNLLLLLQKAVNNNQYTSNPMFGNAVKMFQNNDVKGMEEMAKRIAKEKGTDIETIRSQIGI